MEQQVQNFVFNTQQIRVIIIDGNPWFVAADVMMLLYGQTSGHAHRYDILDATEALKGHPSKFGLGRGRSALLLSESGLYKLVMRSDKPNAKPFQDWVTKDVLPAIRKDGMYVMGEEKVAKGEMSEDELILKAVTILQKKVDRLTQENQVMDRKLNFLAVDTYRALRGEYWAHGQRVQMGKKASEFTRVNKLPVEWEPRTITRRGEKIDAPVKKYERRALDYAHSIVFA